MLKERLKHTANPEIIEPVTSLSNEGKFIHIVSKLPGIAEEKIKIDIDLEKTTITIVAADSTKMYKKIISLPGDVIFFTKSVFPMENSTSLSKKKGPETLMYLSPKQCPFRNIPIVSKFASKTVFQDKSYKRPYSIPDTGEINSCLCRFTVAVPGRKRSKPYLEKLPECER